MNAQQLFTRRAAAALALLLTGAAGAADFDVTEKSIAQLQQAQASGQVTSRQLVEAYLARIRAYDGAGPALNAVLRANPSALDDAQALDRERAARGPRGPLHGIPVLVKDNYDALGMPTSAGTLALATLQPLGDAFQVRRLKEAGAVILGKTTLHELAAGITNVSSLSGVTRNPYHLDRVPGGSSGGTAAAVAASFAAAGMGSDTCGSIRIPAANQNLVGLRPTLGLSSRAGIVPLSASQDVAGPLARSVEDLAVMLDATVGTDPADASTLAGAGHVPASYRALLQPGGLRGARIGVLRALFGKDPDDADTNAVMQKALEALKAGGAEVSDAEVPGLEALLRDTSTIAHEFKFDLADFLAARPGAPARSLGDIITQGLNHEALDATLRLRNTPPARDTEAYRKTLAQRSALRAAVLAAMSAHGLDALAYPVLQRRPALIGEPQRGANCQLSASTGLPAIAIPAGFTADQVPAGLELMGTAFSEARLLALAYDWELAQKPRRAPFSTPPLVGGRAPAVRTAAIDVPLVAQGDALVRLRFSWDGTTSALAWTARLAGARQGDAVLALALHRGTPAQPGPVIAHLLRRGATDETSSLKLGAQDRQALQEGRLYVQAYSTGAPLGAGRVPLDLAQAAK
ncbi:MAG: amidase [Burkholderiales bacterium]|nr:amidase [Burkholderiales bacterium]